MSAEKNARGPKRPVDELVREARSAFTSRDHGPRSDWSHVDEALFARIDTAPARDVAGDPIAARLVAESSPSPAARVARRRWFAVGLIAAAASVALVLHRPSSDSNGASVLGATNEVAAVDRHRTGASAGTLTESSGDLRVGGAAIDRSRALAVGDAIDTGNGRALFTSGSDPQRTVTWTLEATSRVDVRRASPLVLALDHGAVEAQVTPVPHGEAFAIDLDVAGGEPLRVAVHGTHLRVARDRAHVTVDLTEGVVSIGAPPRTGSTYGTLVTAPAHVDIDLTSRAIVVSHDATTVRAAVKLGPAATVVAHGGRTDDTHGTHDDSADPGSHSMPLSTQAETAQAQTAQTAQGIVSNPASARATPPRAADAHPEQTIAVAVKACAVKHLRAADVRVTVSSKLSLRVSDDGLVTFARFDPPLAPAAQECAAASIYKTRFPRAGSFEIPIEVAPEQ